MSTGKPIIGIIVLLVIVLAIGTFWLGGEGIAVRRDTGVQPHTGWSFNGAAWAASESPPDCPEPITLNPPTDVTQITSVLYPGQNRTGGYKTHGGFRFDGKANDSVSVLAPMDAYLVRASRYVEAGEVQYLMFFTHPCGIMYRLDHLLTLTPKWQKVMSTLPPAKIDDSRTIEIDPPVPVTAGEEIAQAVGFKLNNNVSFDFGLYDLRQQNTISKNATWVAQHPNEKEFGFFALCWLDYLESTSKDILKSLPASASDGRQSDYCL